MNIGSTGVGSFKNRSSLKRQFLIPTLINLIHMYTAGWFFLSGSSNSGKWDLNTHLMKIVCNSDFLSCKKKFCPIILSIENERLTFHFCLCGKIALSCGNSYYWYFLFNLEEGEQIILSKVFLMHFVCLNHEETGIMHVYALDSWDVDNIPLFWGVFLEEC